MGLRVTFISGPRSSGKSRTIRTMLERLWKARPHYLRLTTTTAEKAHLAPTIPDEITAATASAQSLPCSVDRIFETLPELLSRIHKADRYGSVVIEADTNPDLRCAYPYDHRVFVMPMPGAIHEVFREKGRAAEELRRVLDDTAYFASEVFGLFAPRDEEPSERRPEPSAKHMRAFLNSPLGDELATRIQLQQPFHGLVESEVIIVNSQTGMRTGETDECLGRVEQLLERIRQVSGRNSELFVCDPGDPADATTTQMLQSLRPMCQRGS